MKPHQTFSIFSLFFLTGALTLQAASGSWTGATDANWADANWSASPVPGTGNTATFNGAGNGNTTINLGTGVTILDVIFNTGSAAGYTIGAGAAGSQTLILNNSGAITLNSSVVNNELFNSAIVLGTDATAQTYTFANNSAKTLTLAGNIYGGPAGGTAGTKTLAINGSGNTVISGNLTNGSATTIALTKTGSGTLTIDGALDATTGLNAQGAYGLVTVNGGILALNFSNFSASGNADMLDSYTPVSLGGATLQVVGNAAYASTQNFINSSGVTVNPGFNVISVGPNGGNLADPLPTLNLGAFTQTLGAQTEFIGPAYDSNPTGGSAALVPATGSIQTSTLGLQNKLLWSSARSAIATVGLYNWASAPTSGSGEQSILSGDQVSGFYTLIASGTTANADNNLDVTGNISLNSGGYNDTMRFNTAAAITCSLAGTTYYTDGGILVTPNVAAHNIIFNLNTHSLKGNNVSSGSGPDALEIYQNNPGGELIFTNGTLLNYSTIITAYVQGGPGTVVLALNSGAAGTSAYSAGNYLNGGVTEITSDGSLGNLTTGTTVNLNGGTLLGGATFTLDNSGANARPITLLGNGGGLAATAGNTLTIDGQIGSGATAGPLVIGIPASAANGYVAGLAPGTGGATPNPALYGTGTVKLNYATGNYYYGGVIILGGATLNINSQWQLGGANQGPVTFNNGTLQYSNTLYNTVVDISGQPVTLAGNATIDVNGNAITYANSIGNGGSGALTVASTAAAGTLTLQGANTYAGGTTINSGAVLNVNNTSGSGTGSGNVTVAGGGTLGGTGAVAGNVTWQSGAQGLFTAGSPLAVAGSVTLNGNALTVYVPNGLPLGSGTYPLLTAAGGITGSFATNSPIFTGAGLVSGAGAAVSTTGTAVLLVVTAPGIQATWTNNVNGNWSGGTNWSSNPNVPHSAGDTATLGGSSALRTVTLDANETVGALALTNANSFVIANAGHALTLNNNGLGALVVVSAGTANAIQTGVALNDNAQLTVGGGDALAISGTISNSPGVIRTLAVNGAGTTILSGANSYGPAAGSPGTSLSGGGVLQIGNSGALGAGDVNVTDGSTLQAGAPGLALGNNLILGQTVTATIDNNGQNLAWSGNVSGGGALTKIGNGILALNGNNSYTGNTTVSAGALSLSSPANIVSPGIILNGGDLLGSGTFAITNGIDIGPASGGTPGTALIDAAGGQTFELDGVVASAGNTGANNLTIDSLVANPGAVVLGGANTFNGTAVIATNGMLVLDNPAALADATLNYSSGTLTFSNITTATLAALTGTNNNLVLATASGAPVTLTVGNNGSAVYAGSVSGSGSVVMTGSGSQIIGSGPNGGANYSGNTTIKSGTLTLGGVGNLTSGGNLDISGSAGPANLILADSAVVSVGGIIQVLYDGGAAYPAVSSLTVTNNASLSGAALSFGDGSRLANHTSVTVAGNGSLNVAGAVDLNANIGSTAQTTEFYLNGGTTTVGNFVASDGYAGTHQSQINFNGGVLAANSSDPGGSYFLPALAGLTAAVNQGGAVINPNGYDITIAAPLVHGGGTVDGGLTVNGSGTVTLDGVNTYNGNTTVSNGTLALGGSGSIAASQHIIVGSGGIFDVTALGQFTLSSTQSLGNSTSPGSITGSVNTGAGAVSLVYSNGSPALTIDNGTLTLASTSIFQITNVGPPLTLGTYKLISTNTDGTGFITGTPPTAFIIAPNALVTNTAPSLLITNGELYLVVATGSYTNAVIYGPVMAFPGALGFGANATGGRAGTVYHVTSLADDGSPGTFRAAVSQGNRIIVFDVGGYINLGSAVSAASNLTIAGQTAPGGGIGLMGNELSFYNQNNIICRGLRVRQGGSSSGSSGINIGSNGGQANNMIFDHTSVEFGQWDSIDAVGTGNFTVQNCIIADPINQQFGAHVQGANASYVGNLWVNAHNRQPLAKASTVYVNNVVYDYQAGYTTADTAGSFTHDIVNNYFITGPSSTAPQDDFFQFDGGQTVYAVGNLLDSSRNGTLNGVPTAPGGDTVSATPWSTVTATIPTVSATTAYRTDVSNAGPFPSDQLDALVIGQVMSLGTSGNLITSPGNTGLGNGGFGTINGGTPLVETDGDGIPDIWKNAVGLNLYTNQAMATAPDGYTYIEDYINWLAAPHAFVQTNATVIDLWQYTLGFTNGGTYTVSGAHNGSVTVTNSHYAFFKPNPGFTGLTSFNFVVADPDGTTMTNTMGLLVSITYIPKSLVWRGDGVNNIWDTTNTADWFNGNNLGTFNSSDNVTLDDTGSASPAITVNGLVAPGSLTINAAQNYTIGGSGSISGAGTLTKSGAGTLTVNNANTLSGAEALNGGTIQFNDGSSLGSGALTIQNGTVVNNYAAGDYLNLANALVVPAGAAATIDLGNDSDLTGSLTGAGTLNLNVQNTGATDEIKGNYTAFAGTVNLLGSGGLLLVANGGAFSGLEDALTTINAPVTLGFHDNSGGNTYYFGALSGNNPNAAFYDQYAGAPTLSIGALNLSTTFAGQFQSSVNVTKTGTGTLTLSGNSTHTGNTTVSSGVLAVTGSFSSSPVTVDSGAILEGNGILGNGVTLQSGGILEPDLGVGSFGTLTVSNSLNLNTSDLDFNLSSSPTGSNDEILLPGGTLNESGVQTYNLNLVNNALGAGTYTLIGGAAGNNYGGSLVTDLPTSTRQGFSIQNTATGVQLVVTGSASSLVWRGTNGGNWDLATTVNWLNGAVADEFYNLDVVRFDDTATNGNVNINGVVQPAEVLVTNNATAYTIGGGVLGGITSLVKTGPGSLTLNSSNSYTGGTFVNGGTLQLVTSFNAGGFGPIALNGGTLYLNGVGTGSTITSAGTNSLVTYGQPYATFNLQGSGQLNVTLGGGGTFSPSGDWSGFSGTINFTTGNWLREVNTTAFGSAAAVWNFGVNGGINNKYGGATVSFGALFGGPASALAGASTAPATQTTYVVGGVNTNSVFNGTISDGASPTALVVNGPAALTLTGNNTFSGNTTVNGGALIINSQAGSGTGSGTVTINSGATLGGNGIIGGQVSLAAGATLAPGSNGSGTLTITNDLGLNNGSTLDFQLGAGGSQVAVTGDLTLAGTLNLTATAGFGPGKYPIFTYGGALSVATLTIGTAPAGYDYTLDTSVVGQVNVIVTAPQFGSVRATPGGLALSGSGGTPNTSYYVLTTTNLATPLLNWTPLLTNQFDANGNFSVTNATAPGNRQQFYRLEIP
jgi:autotransporter-associated beta strand protein